MRSNYSGAVMVGESLHEFDLRLCDYLLDQIRGKMIGQCRRPQQPLPELEDDECLRLPFAEWLGRRVALLPEALADHIWADEPALLVLNDQELDYLKEIFDDPLQRCEDACMWVPNLSVHQSSDKCREEISRELTWTDSVDWNRDCSSFGEQLTANNLTILDGIKIVRNWLVRTRKLLTEMNANRYLPFPEGSLDTPTNPLKIKINQYKFKLINELIDEANSTAAIAAQPSDGTEQGDGEKASTGTQTDRPRRDRDQPSRDRQNDILATIRAAGMPLTRPELREAMRLDTEGKLGHHLSWMVTKGLLINITQRGYWLPDVPEPK